MSIPPDGRRLAYVAAEGDRSVSSRVPSRDPAGGYPSRLRACAARYGLPTAASFYYRLGDRFYAVGVVANPELRASAPELLFEASGIGGFDVHPDGQGFVALAPGGTP